MFAAMNMDRNWTVLVSVSLVLTVTVLIRMSVHFKGSCLHLSACQQKRCSCDTEKVLE